jgi:D-alanyl-D-alanine carboxypeptidase
MGYDIIDKLLCIGLFMVEKLQKILNATVDNRGVFGSVVKVSSPEITWMGSAGNMNLKTPFFIASTTKLYTAAIIFQLCFEKKMDLEDRIANYIDSNVLDDLHVLDDKEYSHEITIKQLLSHTSGIADYFEQKNESGDVLANQIKAGIDLSWSFEELLTWTKGMPSKFRPGEESQAFYSDTNYQLLGYIIEKVTGLSFDENLMQRVVEPLSLSHTYMFRDIDDTKPIDMYCQHRQLHIPKAMSSFGCDGGIVSNVDELMTYIKAFYDGTLFPKSYIEDSNQWNKLFFPLEYGMGMMRFKLPRIFTPFNVLPELIGHSGTSGAFAFYAPEKELFIVGTVNQSDKPGRAYKLLTKLATLTYKKQI